MTKQEEIALLDDLIGRLRDTSYLGDILVAERAAIIRAIESDHAFIDLAGLERQIADQRQELAKLNRHKETVETECRQLQRELDRKQGMLADLRAEAKRILA